VKVELSFDLDPKEDAATVVRAIGALCRAEVANLLSDKPIGSVPPLVADAAIAPLPVSIPQSGLSVPDAMRSASVAALDAPPADDRLAGAPPVKRRGRPPGPAKKAEAPQALDALPEDDAPVPEARITDADLSDALAHKNGTLKDAQAIRALVKDFTDPGAAGLHHAANIPQARRAAFLTALKAL
jgi:hypothetical protein